jgi:hypothetical protein
VGCCTFNFLYVLAACLGSAVAACGIRSARRYAPIISTSWFVYNCVDFDDGTTQLMPAPHLDCFDDAWTAARVYAILSLTLWGIVAPLGLAFTLQACGADGIVRLLAPDRYGGQRTSTR